MEESEHTDTTATRHRWPHKLAVAAVVLVIVVCAAVAAFLTYTGDYYHNLEKAAPASAAAVPVEQGQGYLAFGSPQAKTGLVLYPGAKVEYTAYSALMRDLAQEGYFAVVVEMPFNLAFFDIDAADRVRTAYPDIDTWWVGGHSLGGSMAAEYAAKHVDELGGLVLLAAYSATDLSSTNLGVLSVYGSEDGVLDLDKFEANAALLPPGAETVKIDGGNHAGFGTYGLQSGDGLTALPGEEQRALTVQAIDAYINSRTVS